MTRASGVLLPISSLANAEGIGSLGKSAYQFVDFLAAAGQSYWQILPLGPTSYGDSPYQSFSAFAGNTNFIDLKTLVDWGLIEADDYQGVDWGNNPEQIDYAKVFYHKRPILEKAVASFLKQADSDPDYQTFVQDNQDWLQPFAEFMAVKEYYDLSPISDWPEAIRLKDEEAVEAILVQEKNSLNYHYVSQYFFFKQWFALKDYANQKGIYLIGDIPIYVASDSVEVWQTPRYFKLNQSGQPQVVAGCPPDAFSSDGQLWGNPIYDWETMAKDNYQWWIKRIQASLNLYDMVRIDHFRGFEAYWEIPASAPTAASGKWVKGPGLDLFLAIKETLGSVNIIAENLGFLTQEVADLLEVTGFPGMHVMQFGFSGEDSSDLPHNFNKNSVAYVGTHDNQTALGWYLGQDAASRYYIDAYCGRQKAESVAEMLNRSLAASCSQTVIYTMQDLLNLDDQARINIPSTLGGNWQWRMSATALTYSLVKDLYSLTRLYHRLPIVKNFP
ncbi:4-alpha-glucanotransferase [Aerococcus urinae]|uniref:4-alpha-glucanotransferase n=1 Tax=Aerococcus urinae TaxID=1376 RepID=UPI0018A6F801|nr:4-alpha-glucanotransferase [Aerococcus urinae]